MDTNNRMISTPECLFEVEQNLSNRTYRLDNTKQPFICTGVRRVVCVIDGQVCKLMRSKNSIKLAKRFFLSLPRKLRRLAVWQNARSANIAGTSVRASTASDYPPAVRVIKQYFSLHDTSFSQFKSEHRMLCDSMRRNILLAKDKFTTHMVTLYQSPDIFEDRLHQMLKINEFNKDLTMVLPVFKKMPCLQSKDELAIAIAECCIQWEIEIVQHGLSNNDFYKQAMNAQHDDALCALLAGVCGPGRQFFMRSVYHLTQYERAVWRDREFIHSAGDLDDFVARMKERRAETEKRYFGAGGLVTLHEEIVVRLRSFIDSKECIDLSTGDLILPARLRSRDVDCFKSYAFALLRHYQQLSDFYGQPDYPSIRQVEPLLNICRVFLQIMTLTNSEL